MAPRSSITKRWLLNSFGIIVVIMVAMVIGVSAAMHSFYYNSASQSVSYTHLTLPTTERG